MKGLTHASKPLLPLAASLLVVAALVSGCTIQEAAVQKDSATLAAAPVVDTQLVKDDFALPSQRPSLKRGKKIYEDNCLQCHAAGSWQSRKAQEDLAYTTPIDLYLFLTKGQAPEVMLPNHERRQVLPAEHGKDGGELLTFREKLSRDDRWAVLFYTRYLAGAGDFRTVQPKIASGDDVAAIFGGNCAVCHGKRGFGDGPLHLGRTGNHEVHDGEVRNLMLPPPANFNDTKRLYNRTDAQLAKYICEGIYPSAMPAWFGDVSRDYKTGKINYVFNEELVLNLVRHVRTFGYENDLSPDEQAKAPVGLASLQPCRSVPTNQPWTEVMKQHRPKGAPAATKDDAKPEWPLDANPQGEQGENET